MGMRDAINQTPAVGGAVVIVLLAVAAFVVLRSGPGTAPRTPQHRYLYDLASGELVTGAAPTSADGGRVVARVFTCGDCDDEASRFIAHLEKPNPDPDVEAGEMPNLIRAVDGEQWVPPVGEKAMQIAMEADAKCDGRPRIECYPDR